MDDFTISLESDSSTVVITVSGELDLATAPELEAALSKAEQLDSDRVVLDLRQLDFIDSTGIRLLLMAAQRARVDGERLRIRPGKGQVERVLKLTRADEMLPLQHEE